MLRNGIKKYSDMSKDIAVLNVKDCPIRPIKHAAVALAGIPVFVWGFPSKDLYHYPDGKPIEDCDLSKTTFAFPWKEEVVQGANKWNQKPEVKLHTFQIKNKFEVGFSGSPVCYNITNQVIGMLTAKDNDYGYVIPIQTILEKFGKEKDIIQPSHMLNTEYYISEGNDLFDKGNYGEAIRQYEKVIDDPNYITALFNKGMALLNLRKYKQAIEWYNKALAIDSEDVSALRQKGWALYKLGKNKQAIEWYNKALAIDPNNVIALDSKGEILMNLRKHNQAIRCFNKALAINPNYTYALNDKGLALYKLGKYKQALKYFDTALAIDPSIIDSSKNRRLALFKIRNQALKKFRRKVE